MKVHKTLKLSNSFSDNHASSSFFFSLTVKVLQNIVVDDRANSLSIPFFVQGPSEGQPDCHSFLCVPRSKQKRGKSLSPFLESSSYSICHLYVLKKHLPTWILALKIRNWIPVYLESRKVGSLKKCWAFKMAFTCTICIDFTLSLSPLSELQKIGSTNS